MVARLSIRGINAGDRPVGHQEWPLAAWPICNGRFSGVTPGVVYAHGQVGTEPWFGGSALSVIFPLSIKPF